MAVETTTFSNNSADTWFRDIMFDCVLCPRACHEPSRRSDRVLRADR